MAMYLFKWKEFDIITTIALLNNIIALIHKNYIWEKL